MANLQKIKKGYYTDGERIFSNECGKACVWMPVREESNVWLKAGNETARCFENIEVKPVKAGMTFYNGQIEVIDKNTIKITFVERINAKYDEKGYCISFDGYENHEMIQKN